MVLYRKYRPQKLSEVVGQDYIVKSLLSALESGKIGHGFLFSGPRGTGKTSAARILAKAVNCEVYRLRRNSKSQASNPKFGEPCGKCESCLAVSNGSHLDLYEIDAASNRGIDEIRDLREKIKLAPISSRFKVYIVDEVHMLTNEAFNALLKTLEEPPAHAIFILCTTEPQKLPATIVSRLQRFNFTRASDDEIAKVVEKVAKAENITIAKSAASEIARASDGSFRDAISILDQLSSLKGKITDDDVAKVAKTTGWNQLYFFLEVLSEKKLEKAVLAIENIAASGDLGLFARNVISLVEKILYLKVGLKEQVARDFDPDQLAKLEGIAQRLSAVDVQSLLKLFMIAEAEIKLYAVSQIPIILAVCKYCDFGEADEISQSQSESERELESQSQSENEVEEQKITKITYSSEAAGKSKSKGKKGTKGLAEVEKHWSEFLNSVRSKNAHVVALLKSTRPLEFDGESLTLEVFYRFHKEKLTEPKILEMLDREIRSLLGPGVRLNFILAERGSSPTGAVKKSDVVEVKEESLADLEKIAHEIFSK